MHAYPRVSQAHRKQSRENSQPRSEHCEEEYPRGQKLILVALSDLFIGI